MRRNELTKSKRIQRLDSCGSHYNIHDTSSLLALGWTRVAGCMDWQDQGCKLVYDLNERHDTNMN